MSLEDIRENYKSSRQSNDVKLKLNGSTFRDYRSKLLSTKLGNTIKIHDNGKMNDLDDLNSKYNVIKPNIEYSLNKKKRWNLASELVENMSDFNKEDIDVRLYETRNRNFKKSNCIAIHKSKGENLTVKKTYANLESIRRKEFLDEREKLSPKVEPNQSVKNKNKQKNNTNNMEVIVIKPKEEQDELENYVQYEIEHAPTKDILKHGVNRYITNNEIAHGTKSKYYSSFNDYEEESEFSDDQEEIETDSEYEDNLNKNLNIKIEDLIDSNLNLTTDKNESKLKSKNKSFKSKLNANDHKKDNKIYVDSIKEIKSFENIQTSTKTQSHSIPIPINVQLTKESIQTENLKSLYGLKYTEAFYCWPRNFSINLSELLNNLMSSLSEPRKEYDSICWLTFQQIINDQINSEIINEFRVSVVSNLNCESIFLENINTFETFDIKDLVDKSILFLSSLPIEYYKLKDMNKPKLFNAKTLEDCLPTISSVNQVKTLDDLKLELLNEKKDFKITNKTNYERTNSIEIVKTPDMSENIENRLESIMNKKKFECILCFDEKSNINDCTIIKTCGHSVCNDCMEAYINSRLTNSFSNAGKLQCPGCDIELELALIINFSLDAKKIDLFLKNTIEKVVFVLSNYKWCPSPSCGKIIQVDLNSNPYGTVSCVCGFKMCLRCNNSPHFPAKCSQIANYYKELRMNNDLNDPIDTNCTIEGKRCPNCNYFIEKNGGCNHMTCHMCSQQFCWICMKNWNEHVVCKPTEDTKVVVEFVKERKSSRYNKYGTYQDSIAHRQKRVFGERRILKNNAKRLLETVKIDYDLVNEFNKENILNEVKYCLERKRELRTYLNEIIDFLNELHFICEHGYVLLRDSTTLNSTKNKILNVIKRIESIIWSIRNVLEYGNGQKSIDKLESLHKRGIESINLLKNFKQE